MAKLAAFPEPMKVGPFFAFAAARPEGEKGRLVNGELFLSASPVHPHPIIVATLIRALGVSRERRISGAGRRAVARRDL